MALAAYLLLSLSMTTSAGLAAAPMSAEECTVFRREASFARSVDRHDEPGFAAHLHPQALFNVGSAAVLRGRDAVVEGWRGLIAGTPVKVRWRPQYVHIGGEADLASSHGPFLLERRREDGQIEYAAGRYQSVWQRASDGQWYVLFDGGGEPPRPIDAAAAKTLFDDLPQDCAAGG